MAMYSLLYLKIKLTNYEMKNNDTHSYVYFEICNLYLRNWGKQASVILVLGMLTVKLSQRITT